MTRCLIAAGFRGVASGDMARKHSGITFSPSAFIMRPWNENRNATGTTQRFPGEEKDWAVWREERDRGRERKRGRRGTDRQKEPQKETKRANETKTCGSYHTKMKNESIFCAMLLINNWHLQQHLQTFGICNNICKHLAFANKLMHTCTFNTVY